MDLLLHPADDSSRHRPDRRGRLSTVGHRAAFRAFAKAARRARIRFMVIGGTVRDLAVRAASTRDIDIVLVDRGELPREVMAEAGFTGVPGLPPAWQYTTDGRVVELQVAAVASSKESSGSFSVAYQHAEKATIEGLRVPVPRVEDYVILKLLAAAADRRRRARDLADVQFALEAYPERLRAALSVAAVRGRLRDLYGCRGEQLKQVVDLFRQIPRPPAR